MSTARLSKAAAIPVLAALSLAAPALATPPFAAASRALPGPSRIALLGGRDRVDALIARPGGAVTWTTLPVAALDAMAGDAGEVSVGAVRFPLLGPPRLDQSVARIGVAAVRGDAGYTGRGTVVAVVDTGLDVRHADVRRRDGTTRVAWLLDLSRPSRGVHAELEARFGFLRDDGVRYGAVYSAADLDALLAAEANGAVITALPVDEVGHGTFVTSIAAGNGFATGRGQPDGRYVGVAPEATIVAVRAAQDGADRFTDAAIVAGVAFAVDRARALGEPAVINLSVGGHQGAHDGTSALERALASLVPVDAPGLALVVSAGNDGTEHVHARADLLRGTAGGFSLALADAGDDDVTVVEIVYEGAAEIAVRFPSGVTTAFVSAGNARGFATGEAAVSVANATDESDAPGEGPTLAPGLRAHTATVMLAGDLMRARGRRAGVYSVWVRGEGIVHGYIVDPGAARPTARFEPALESGTVTVPATSPSVVSVGAVASRLRWTTVSGATVTYNSERSAWGALVEGEPASFSARGPNRVNAPRPDLLAPGAFVVAAMSAQATPDQPLSVFGDGTGGRTSALVAEDGVHGVGGGTSAASPHVAGAMALLLQAQPRATQTELLAALASSARGTTRGRARWNRDEGWGEIAVDRALAELTARGADGVVDVTRSEVTSSAEQVTQGEPAAVLVRLVTAEGRAVDADVSGVTVHATAGDVGRVISLGGGRYEAGWRASGVAAGALVEIRARAGGVELRSHARVRVLRDVTNDGQGYAARGGCTVRDARARGKGAVAVMAALAAMARARRRRARVHVTR